MTDRCCTIGLDFGSLSCRGVLVDTSNGEVIAVSEFAYPHGIMDRELPDGTPLKAHFSLQCPEDYRQSLEYIVPELMRISGIAPECVAGICVDFTACTMIPVDEDFKPLSENPAFESRPHAWTKLWKHLGAQPHAEKLTQVCIDQKRPYLNWYGGKMHPQNLVAKVIEVFEEDREVFDAAGGFVEAADYMTSLLVGKPVFGYTPAAAKAFYGKNTGYPDPGFFAAVHPELCSMPQEKLALKFSDTGLVAPWQKAGMMCEMWARKLNLTTRCVVSGPQLDGYAPVAALGIDKAGTMMMIVGTSTAMMLVNQENRPVEGAMACIEDIFYPDMWCYASGQASVGDGFQWFADNCVPERYTQEARRLNMSVQQYLTSLAERIEPGTTGLIALDWYNGNKSCLINGRLSGMFLGLNLNTRPEEIYLAMLEATAFGARVIVDSYRHAGVPVNDVCICGGVAGKNALLMQIYADVLGIPVKVSRCSQAAALGSAIYAAAAAGEQTGYKDIFAAVNAMADREFKIYEPDSLRQSAYEELFKEYMLLHDYFGKGGNQVMERLHEKRK